MLFHRPTPYAIAYLDQFGLARNPTPESLSCAVLSAVAQNLANKFYLEGVLVEETAEYITVRFPGSLADAIMTHGERARVESEIANNMAIYRWEELLIDAHDASMCLRKSPVEPFPFGNMPQGVVQPYPRAVATCRITDWITTPTGRGSFLCTYMTSRLWSHRAHTSFAFEGERIKLTAHFNVSGKLMGDGPDFQRDRILSLVENFFVSLGWTEVQYRDSAIKLICHNLQI